jgi:hypothetical protein
LAETLQPDPYLTMLLKSIKPEIKITPMFSSPTP